ncbi:MAG: hypothetical protein Q8L01_03660 [Candidatus Woesebacteria bacterium]|nr:hypothetical protein [Candidatus Woesebacteria bacterium]
MASHFGQFSKKDNLYHGINLLNKLRNDIAHSLTYNDKHLEDYYSYIFNKNPELKDLNINKTEIEKFKISVAYLCGIVFAFYKYKTDKKDAKRFLKKIDKYRLTSRST